VKTDGPIHDPSWVVEPVSLEDIALAYMDQTAAADRDRGSARIAAVPS
jgi:hypothetical protein